MTQTSRLVLEIDSRDAEQRAADVKRALEALEAQGIPTQRSMARAAKGLEEVSDSSAHAANKAKAQRDALAELLGSIDPVTRKLGELDRQEKELARSRKLGLLDKETFDDYQGKINATRTELGRFNADMTKTGMSAKATAAALRNVPAQFTDIAVSLQAGQAPLTVFLQQGGQLKDMFGGVLPAAKALGGYVLGLINPFTVAAAAVGALGIAYYQGSKEQDAYRISLVTTGNAAGTTTSALAEMAKRVSGTVGTTSDAATALAMLAGNGKITSTSFEQIAIAAISFEKATGRAVSDTVAEFGRLADDPVRVLGELNDKYNFLTASVYEQVRAAKEQGNVELAGSIAQDALAKALTERSATIKENLGSIERAWNDVAGAAKSGWDALLNIGRESSAGPDMTKLRQELAYRKSLLGSGFEDNDTRDRIAAIEKEISAYEKSVKTQQDAAAAAAESARVQREGQIAFEAFEKSKEQNFTKEQKRNKAIEDEIKRINQARAAGYSITKAEEDAALKAIRDNPIYKASKGPSAGRREDSGQRMLDEARQRYAVLQQQRMAISGELGETQKLGAEARKLVELETEIANLKEKKTLTTSQKQVLAMAEMNLAQQKQNAALERANELTKERYETEAKLRAFRENLQSQLSTAREGQAVELESYGQGDKLRQRLQEDLKIRQEYQRELDKVTRDYNRISNPTASDTALYQGQTEALRSALSTRLSDQQAYYAQVDKLQSDWTVGATQAMNTYAEQAADVASQTRNLFSSAFGNMEDAVVNFVKTGKLSFKDFADQVIADLIRIQVRQAAAGFLNMAISTGMQLYGGGANGFAAGSAAATSSRLGASAAGYSSAYGFSSGGYTGPGGVNEPAGIVHKGEVVWSQDDIKRAGGVQAVEGLRNGNVSPSRAATSAQSSSTRSDAQGSQGMPPIQQIITVEGSADEATLARIQQAARQGAIDGYNLVLRDFKQNGPARRMLRA